MVTLPITEHLALRLLQEEDASEMWSLIEDSRAHLRPWMTWTDHTVSPDDTLGYIRGTQRQFVEGKTVAFGIRLDGRLAGAIDLHQIDHFNHGAEIGYWLGAGFQGQGIMTRACSCIVRYGFRDLDLHRIAILVAARNMRSRAIPERLGFVQEGVMRDFVRLYETYHDMAIYSMLHDEWHDLRSA